MMHCKKYKMEFDTLAAAIRAYALQNVGGECVCEMQKVKNVRHEGFARAHAPYY